MIYLLPVVQLNSYGLLLYSLQVFKRVSASYYVLFVTFGLKSQPVGQLGTPTVGMYADWR